MKILLLGKSGLLGNEIFNILKNAQEHDLFALGHEDLDIADQDALYQTFRDVKPDLVINAAAFTYVDECEVKKDFVMTINGHANGNLASICNDRGAYLMYFSTDYVFDGEKDEGYKEDDDPNPINVYGASKLLGEQLIQKNTDNYYIIRTSWLFGMRGRNFVKTILDLVKTKKRITVVDDQFGKPTFTRDLAEGIYQFIKINSGMGGIYHIVNEKTTSWYEFAKKIFDFAKIDNVDLVRVKSDQVDRPAKRPRISILHNTKLPHLRNHEEALYDYLHQLNLT